MDLLRSSSLASRQTQESRPVFTLYPAAVNKDSKAQHVLGLSRSELHSARNQSLKTKAKSTIQQPLSSDRSFRNPFTRSKKKALVVDVEEVALKPEARKGSCDRQSDLTSVSHATSLSRYPSNSTLHSFYDAAAAPLRVSQQTSNSSTRDFTLRKAKSSSYLTGSSEMEAFKQHHFFRSSKPRSVTERYQVNNKILEHEKELSSPPVSSGSNVAYPSTVISTIPEVEPLSVSHSRDLQALLPNDKFLKIEDEKATSVELRPEYHDKPSTNLIANTPYAKVNIRRPKTGTRHWFDDLEGLSSDEEENQEIQPADCDADQGDSVSHKSWTEEASEVLSHSRNSILEHPVRTSSDQIHELSADTAMPSEEATDLLSKGSSIHSKSKPNPLSQADLSQDSMLHLSESEDECCEHNIVRSQPQSVQSSEHCPAIRESVAIAPYEESDVEIGLVRAVVATGRAVENRPSPIKLITSGCSPNSLSSPINLSPLQADTEMSSDGSASNLNIEADFKDVDEEVLLSSFPATPTDTNRPRRTSSQSSTSFSDDRSVVSMRLMKVTKQEENLIAAMRMKRAAMRKAAKAASRENSSRMSESPERIFASAERSSLRNQVLQSNGFISYPKAQTTQISECSHPSADVDRSRPVTAYLADSSSARNQNAPTSLPPEQGWTSRSHVPFPYQPARALSQSQTPRSSATSDSEKHESNVVVIDTLSSELSSRAFPSHLLLEPPFAAWERTSSATVH